MKTIDLILKENNLTYPELHQLEKEGVVNGIGWEWRNFDNYIKTTIDTLYWYDKSKADELFNDIRTLRLIHDNHFHIKNWFYKSNIILAYNLYRLLHWSTIWARLSVSIWAFLITTFAWKKYYNK